MPIAVLRVASDERLVQQVHAGSDRAFDALFARYHRRVFAFCRHMLGSREDAEDAAQLTFLAAFQDLGRGEPQSALRPWLYSIARHRCLSMLRARHERAVEQAPEPGTNDLATDIAMREDLRVTLADVAQLPDDQRAALVLAELGDLPHEEIGEILGCPRTKVKALVFQARSSLTTARTARQTPCAEIREQLATLHGGALLRAPLRRHLHDCPGCREFQEHLRMQRRALRLLLPVAPTAGLRHSVLGAIFGSSGGAGDAVTAGALSVSGLAATALVLLAVPTGVIMAVIDQPGDRRAPVGTLAPTAWAPAAGVVAERAGAEHARAGPDRQRASERLHITGGTGPTVQTVGYGKSRDQAEPANSPGADGGAGDEAIPVAVAEPAEPPTPGDGAQPAEPASSNGELTPVGRPDPAAPATAEPADAQDARQNTSAEPADLVSSNGELRPLGRPDPSAPAAADPADGQGVRQDARPSTQPPAAPAGAKIPEPARTNGRDTPPAPAKPPSPSAGRQSDPARLPDPPGPDGRVTPGKPADRDRGVTPANPADPTEPQRADGRPTSGKPDGHAEMPPAGSPGPRANAAPEPTGTGRGARERSPAPSPASFDKSGRLTMGFSVKRATSPPRPT